MIWMMIIMILPLLGIPLFFLLPLAVALPLYLILFAVSGTYHCLMMRALRFPLQVGPDRMAGSEACVLGWRGSTGQVIWNSEIWKAETPAGATTLANGEKVVITGRDGLTLRVRSASEPPSASTEKNGAVGKCGLDRLLALPQLARRHLGLGGFEKVFTRTNHAERFAR